MNSTRRSVCLGVLLLGLAAAGRTASAQQAAAAQPVAPQVSPSVSEVTVGTDANGTTVNLHPGQMLILRLAVCRGCGFHWRVLAAGNGQLGKPSTTLESSAPPAAPGQPPMLGGIGTAVFTFTAERSGSTDLRLALYPPGRGAGATQTFRLHVAVSAGQAQAALERWAAVSTTAMSITGDVSFAPDRIRLQNGQSLSLAPAGSISGFATAGGKVDALLYKVTRPNDRPLLHGNHLCGGHPATFIAMWKDAPSGAGINRGMAVFSTRVPPTSENDACGTFGYEAGERH